MKQVCLLPFQGVLDKFPFPSSVIHQLRGLGDPNSIIQRVSKASFVIRTKEGLFNLPSTFALMVKAKSTAVALTSKVLLLFQQCIHHCDTQNAVFTLLWALLSVPSMQSEFSLYLLQRDTGIYIHVYIILLQQQHYFSQRSQQLHQAQIILQKMV